MTVDAPPRRGTVALAMVCKTPLAGESKTRLAPLFCPEECAQLSACFIADLSNTIHALTADGNVVGYAVYTPEGSEAALKDLLPSDFELLLQYEGDFGARLDRAIEDLIALGHAGAILINSDSPTLPRHILSDAVDAVRGGDKIVLGPAIDGGYTLIGLSRPHPQLFTRIPWSTAAVFESTLERAREIELPVVVLDAWYDVDDATSYALLESELTGSRPAFASASAPAEDAPRTRAFLSKCRTKSSP
jgi:rSAM/selenodomain-associated transferase 1